MFGIELTEFLLFARQLGIAMAGAAALWGFIFSQKDFHCGEDTKCVIYDWIAVRIMPLFLIGVGIGTVSYVGLLMTVEAAAHQGIAYLPSTPEVAASFPILTPLFFVLILATLIAISLPNKGGEKYANWITYFYGAMFVVCFAITSFPAWRGELDARQLFYAGHGFHSIFTVGSVIVLDYLYIMSTRAEILKQHIFALFPTISAVVWYGLAFDLLSSLLIIEGFEPTTKLIFMQTVIGILIINGVFLSGPLARQMLSSVEPDGKEVRGGWKLWANIAGAVSVVSWVTITFVDSFENLPFSYLEYFGIYIGVIILAIAGHSFMECMERRTEPPEFIHN
ncbi:MAG: hypothetical protein WD335_00520 [Candidatus Paceibacterota bacterium]